MDSAFAGFARALGANADFYDPQQDNARRWYKFSQERVPLLTNFTFVAHHGLIPVQDKKFAVVFKGRTVDLSDAWWTQRTGAAAVAAQGRRG